MKNYNEDVLLNMSSGLIVMDNKGILQTINPQAEKIIGRSKEDVIGKKHAEIWPLEKEFVRKLSHLSAEDNGLFKETKFHVGNIEKTLAITTTPLKDMQKKIKGKLAVINDLTEFNKLEMHVRRSDKLTALGRMAAGVAHEIKNPLTSMRLFVQMMSSRQGTDPKFWAEHSDILMNELDRLDKIVGDFVGFAKTPELKLEDVQLSELIDKVLRLINIQAQELKVLIDVMVDHSLIIKGDGQRLVQVLMNLILNAMQAMPQGKKDGRIILRAKELSNKMAEIEVIDNGAGITKENLDKLFTPFFTTKEKGTGLGLSIIHRLIEEHGGQIDVKSKLGVGTTFIITLPTPETRGIIPVDFTEKAVEIH
ncbi:MAG: ATP-binding protein, partial [Candidatus Margulisiibacteriota bacterium]|jgi:PAS domain S-box-containing protein